MPIIEIVGATTIAIIIFSEFLAAIGIVITLYKIHGVTRRFNTGPEVHHHHHYQSDLGLGDEDGYGEDSQEVPDQEAPDQERPF